MCVNRGVEGEILLDYSLVKDERRQRLTLIRQGYVYWEVFSVPGLPPEVEYHLRAFMAHLPVNLTLGPPQSWWGTCYSRVGERRGFAGFWGHKNLRNEILSTYGVLRAESYK